MRKCILHQLLLTCVIIMALSFAFVSIFSGEAFGLNITPDIGDSPPAAPSNLTAAGSGSDVVLNWADNSDNDLGFLVEKRSPGGSWVEIGCPTPDVTSFSDRISAFGTYYYRVRAFNNYGTSDYSNEVSAVVESLTVTGTTITLQINYPYMTVNDSTMEIDPGRGTVPVIFEDRTLLPIRAIVEALGGTISWDETSRKVTIEDNGTTIELWIGNYTTYVNGNKNIIDAAPQIINDRTMIPVRFVVENLGAAVDWDSANKAVIIRR